jgi:hypothetical protein
VNIAPLIGALGWSMRNTRDVDDDISREAAKLLRRVIEAVAKGELEARTPDARALLRRLEGALIALEASSPKGESEHVMIWLYVNRGFSVLSFEGGVRQEQSTLTAGPSFIGRHEEGVSGRIDLGARLGPALTACIGVTTRGVWASHLSTGCQDWLAQHWRRDVSDVRLTRFRTAAKFEYRPLTT